MADNVDVKAIARGTPGFNGAGEFPVILLREFGRTSWVFARFQFILNFYDRQMNSFFTYFAPSMSHNEFAMS